MFLAAVVEVEVEEVGVEVQYRRRDEVVRGARNMWL